MLTAFAHMTHSPYVGRFAPTPTGPLHFGSLVAALASYLDAKAHNGTWLLRIEDLDPPREDPTASTVIPQQLQDHGLLWDGDIQFQSQHSQRYEAALSKLAHSKHTFHCQCSRKQLAQHHGLHLGPCDTSNTEQTAIRLAVPDQTVSFNDEVYGAYSQNLLKQVGDQVLKRKDGLFAYQLAVVVDDHHSEVTHVVRGVDLLDNTPRQLYLMNCLGYDHPHYLHLPLVVNDQGQKLSKQNKAMAIEAQQAKQNLIKALVFLKQTVTPEMKQHSIAQLLNQAVDQWDPKAIVANHAGLH